MRKTLPAACAGTSRDARQAEPPLLKGAGRKSYSEQERERVRAAFLDAGRRLLAGAEAGSAGAPSMRRIAAEAGYSAAAIYQYFHDQRSLLVALRQLDMDAATDVMEAAAARTADPVARVREVFLAAAHYWLAHPDHFDILFSGNPSRSPLHTAEGAPFGRSPTVLRSLALYTRVVEEFLAALPRRPVATRMAVDTLIAATHGVIAFPRATASMDWSATAPMVACTLDALLSTWTRQAHWQESGSEISRA